MLFIARRLSYRHPCTNPSLQNKMVRLAARSFCDKRWSESDLTTKDKDDSGGVGKTKEEIKQLIFSDEEKALMKDVHQRIPFTVETSPGIYSYENAVRPMVPFPDPTFVKLESHEDVREYSLGFPVIRPPAPVERWIEGLRLKKSSSEDYPWIQEFKSQYDYLIVGGGAVGSCIANFLASRIKVGDGFRVGVIEKDPTYRRSNSTQMLANLKMQHSFPESIDSALFAADFLRMSRINLTVPMDFEVSPQLFNEPNVKFQPHGNLTLVTEESLEALKEAHTAQGLTGAQTALLTKRGLEKRFPWLNTNGISAGCLGLEGEGWFDSWNFLQSLILRNKYLGVDYIHGEAMFMKKHCSGVVDNPNGLSKNYEVHIFLPNSKKVYPIEFSRCVIAAGGQSGNIGRMAGIGTGKGIMYMDIPVEPKRGYIFEIKCPDGPGLNFPLVWDPSGFFMQRMDYLNHYLVGKLPSGDLEDKIPENMFGDVDPDYFDAEILPLIQYRIPGLKDIRVVGSRAVDYDYNYIDGSPVIGHHPVQGNILMATGFHGRGSMFAPAVGRGITELLLDDGYTTIDFSRFSFDRFLNKVELRDKVYA